ncbi:GTPase ObgE [Dehalococcoides mccartyi]|jgi:GTP-binding protein|uniref:GTPase ObgE n=1 Tax=Dehalococcoides mccartyi TaxID=61435 RepID=UPI00098FAEF6|nr:GTPase ObgE [Dehalococcoides mccartyi]AQU05144.1 GTPase ObgE [Dehalococcoides mccartyi]AQU06624.1 GTPase ObgE [Dehalococcoides mccartyi]AQX73978.1 GTPase ObgE [Dehalococcoides mccartyi]AQY72493.1 GTPase ObgE [Dehalococcoides mccartyi]
MFDRVEINIKAGDGGSGKVSFRREKFVPYGGPDGGDGGDGGNVYLEADSGLYSLLNFKHKRVHKASNGEGGMGSRCTGHNGADLVIKVPVGTVATILEENGQKRVLADLAADGDRTLVAHGGQGGLGNTHFVSSTNQAPMLAQKGQPGGEFDLILELKLIADVAIIGYPNVGKSSLLSLLTAAKPKVANYPFTTLSPVMGVIERPEGVFVMAEVPGLIENAHLGKGLGHDFLRHISRTRMVIHLLDGTSENPIDDMIKVNSELYLYDASLSERPQVVAINKIDDELVQLRREELKETFKEAGLEVFFISALTGEGVDVLLAKVAEKLDILKAADISETTPDHEVKIFRPAPKGKMGFRITRLEDGWQVEAPEIERIIEHSDIEDPEVRRQVMVLLKHRSVQQSLIKSGAVIGQKIITGRMEWYL